jgi:hypothetical protein
MAHATSFGQPSEKKYDMLNAASPLIVPGDQRVFFFIHGMKDESNCSARNQTHPQ